MSNRMRTKRKIKRGKEKWGKRKRRRRRRRRRIFRKEQGSLLGAGQFNKHGD